MMVRPIFVSALALALAGCSGGVPVELRIDQVTIDLSLDDAVGGLVQQVNGSGLLPPGTGTIPEVWPEALPDVCFEYVASTEVEDGRIDLTPDPAEDPENAELFGAINDGIVDRIELNGLWVRVEQNTLNVPLPVVEVQAADSIEATGDDRRQWRTLGGIGGPELSGGCDVNSPAVADAAQPGELIDLEYTPAIGGESFLNAQLADSNCLQRQMDAGESPDPQACKEFTLRARTRATLDTAKNPNRPRGAVRLRLIIAATFFVSPL